MRVGRMLSGLKLTYTCARLSQLCKCRSMWDQEQWDR